MLRRLFSLVLLIAALGAIAYWFDDIKQYAGETLAQKNAKYALDSGNLTQAITEYEKILQEYPDNVRVALRLAELYEADGKPGKAEMLYRNIIQATSGVAEAHIGLAKMMRRNPDRLDEAVLELRKALQASPSNAWVLGQLGEFYKHAAANPKETRPKVKRKLRAWADYYYRLSLKADARVFDTNFGLGVLNQEEQDLEMAAQYYCNALLLDPLSYEARYNLGLVLVDMDYLDLGYQQLDGAVKVLFQQDRVGDAQDLAHRVQNVKIGIYNSGRSGLRERPFPDFLKASCTTLPEAGSTDIHP